MKDPTCDETSRKLNYPPINDMIPENLDVLNVNPQYSHQPLLLKRWSDDTDLWYKKDDKFKKPKAIVYLKTYTNDINAVEDINARVFTAVWG